jgi:putative hydrolase of the HAD superfamily
VSAGRLQFILLDWGDTLMSEDGPVDIPMADWPTVRTMDGALEVITALGRSYRLAIATNATVSSRADIVRALARVGLTQFVSEIFCYTELGHKKDEPEFWQIVLARLGARSDEVVMVGDSLEQDVLSPCRAGLPAIWLNWKRANEDAAGDVPIIHSLRELPNMLPRHS